MPPIDSKPPTAGTPDAGREKAIMRKVTWRIVPFVFVLYIVSYLDRANIAYAALQMNAELALSSEAFGLASGVFFIGYFLFEVPSNVMLNKFGARIWIARILVTWGIIAAAIAFVQSASHLYVLRFLLGVAEAGFFPGVIVYLTYWFRNKEIATTVALFTAAIPVSYIIGAPLSTWIMTHVHWLDWSGWRWMLFIEGGLAFVFGIVCYFHLTDRPADAKWLSAEEKAWLTDELERDRSLRKNVKHLSVLQTMKDRKVLYLSFIYLVYQCGSLGVGYWMPQIIKSLSHTLTTFQVGLIAMVPYVVATIAMVAWSHRSDVHNERRMHTAIPLGVAAVALLATGYVSNTVGAVALISCALAGLYAFKSPFWALPPLFLTRDTASISIAVINSIGNLGGFIGPYLIGVIKSSEGAAASPARALVYLSGLLAVAFLMAILIRVQESRNAASDATHQQVNA